MPNIPLLICGQGRCGTSLCLSMLDAGGVPTAGAYPSYEDDAILGDRRTSSEIKSRYAGRAVKWLQPVLRGEAVSPWAKVIYLVRDPAQQARSALKLLGASADRRSARAFAASMRRDDQIAVRALKQAGPFMLLSFETMIADPALAAHKLGIFAGDYAPSGFDAMAAARKVRPRGPECQSDLSIEMSQVTA